MPTHEEFTAALDQSLMVTESDSLVLMPTMNLQIAKARLREFQEFISEYMREGEDYGTIPGTPKPTLYKPGADKLCELYGLSDSYIIVAKVEDFDKGLFDYTIECQLVSRRNNQFVSSGLGCCSSWESKYRWRNESRKCPNCGKEAIIKGKVEYGGGWVCFKKKDGCGLKFKDNDPSIMEQVVGRLENPDIIDAKNTVLKMAKKRAKIDATLSATRSSGVFTQDLEDIKHGATEPDYDERGELVEQRTPAEQKDFGKAKAERMKAETKQQPAVEGACSECGGTSGHKWGCSQLKKPAPAQGQLVPSVIGKMQNIELQGARKRVGIPDEDYHAVLVNNGCQTGHGPDILRENFDQILREINRYGS